MRIKRISPGLTLLTILLSSFLLSLGMWQLERATEKEELIRMYRDRLDQPAISITGILDNWQAHHYRRVTLTGSFLTDNQVLLENQVRKGRAGVHDYRVFKTEDDIQLLVNLGWQASSAVPPSAPSGILTLEGLVRPPPEVGLRLGNLDDTPFTRPLMIPYLDIDWISGRFDVKLEPFVVLLEDETTATDEWIPIPFPPEKHRGYALTWFSLAATLLILFGFYSFTKQPKNTE